MTLELSINTDYEQDVGDPEPYLRQIAEANFTNIHWVHHFTGDYLYSRHEIEQIGRWLATYGLKLNDIHASDGKEKYWLASENYARRSGVALVQNRIEMTAVLGGDAIVLHLPAEPNDETNAQYWARLRQSLDELLPYVQENGVRIALENSLRLSNHAPLKKVLAQYSPNEIGVCYDSGHGNVIGDGLDFLDSVKDRLIALHLNDNDGTGDQHNLLFSETVDWERLASIIAVTAYDKPLCMELTVRHSGIEDLSEFLAQAMTTGTIFAQMVENARKGK